MKKDNKQVINNMDNKARSTILILYGGCSTEHEISCNSASTILSVFANLPYALELCGISKNGIWYRQDSSTQIRRAQEKLPLSIEEDKPVLSIIPGKGIFTDSVQLPCSYVFPILHGSYGEDGTLQGLLEYSNLPYVGADVTSSVLGSNKKYCKILWKEAGLPTLPFLSFERRVHTNYSKITESICNALHFPVFVKPNSSGSSVGISKVGDKSALPAALDLAFSFDTTILVETGVEAREIEVSVIGNHNAQVFPPGELITDHDFYSYDAKYIDSKGTRTEIPARLNSTTRESIQQIARQAYNCIGCKGLARVDFFLTKDESIYLNEINTMPGFTSISMFPQLVTADGLSLQELLQRLIRHAEERFSEQSALQRDYQ